MKTSFLFVLVLLLHTSGFSQNVGIGTVNPVFKLDVRNGSINVDSVYRIDSITVLAVSGIGNLFVGKNAGRINAGTGNTFSGDQAGYSNTTGLDNSFFGNTAGYSNNSGNYNSFFGRLAGYNNTGIRNSFFGQAAGLNNTTGTRNSFFGQDAGLSNTTANYNSFFGHAAGISDTTGNSNSFFGQQAGPYNASGNSNSFFGQNTGFNNTTGNENSFLGQAAGFFNTTGNYNSFFGRATGSNNTSGTYNTAVGLDANVNTGTLTNATAIGAKARVDCNNCLVLGSVNGTNGASSNVKVGIGTTNPVFKLDVKNGSINTDSVYRIGAISVLGVPGTGNLFVGENAGRINTAGFNTFSGDEAGYSNTSGATNTFFGAAAGYSNTTSHFNSFFGGSAGYSNSTGSSNSFFGRSSGLVNSNGKNNSFFGSWAGSFNTSGINNTAVGDSANVGAGILTNATALGAKARVDCSNCMVLGSVSGINGGTSGVKVGIGINNPDATLDIARGIGFGGTAVFHGTTHTTLFNTGIVENTYIRAGKDDGFIVLNDIPGGKVGIGTDTPNAPLGFAPSNGKKITLYPGATGDIGFSVQPFQLRIHGDGPGTVISLGIDQAGVFTNNLDVYSDGGAWLRGILIQNSDARLKKNITPLQNSLGKIILLNGYNYYWKAENAEAGMQTGIIAQEVQKLFPELVKEDKAGMLSVNYSGLIPVLIESIKEQQKQIDELKKLVEKLTTD